MEQHTLFYTNTTKPMSNESQNRNQIRNLTRKASMPTFAVGNDEEVDIEDEESEFKMGRLIRQASLNSSQMAAPQQVTKVMTGSSSLPARYPSQKLEANQEKISMRKFESMKERSRSKNSVKMSKNNGCPPTIPWGWADDKGSSEDMKAHIKFWARAVAFNVHQEC